MAFCFIAASVEDWARIGRPARNTNAVNTAIVRNLINLHPLDMQAYHGHLRQVPNQKKERSLVLDLGGQTAHGDLRIYGLSASCVHYFNSGVKITTSFGATGFITEGVCYLYLSIE